MDIAFRPPQFHGLTEIERLIGEGQQGSCSRPSGHGEVLPKPFCTKADPEEAVTDIQSRLEDMRRQRNSVFEAATAARDAKKDAKKAEFEDGRRI